MNLHKTYDQRNKNMQFLQNNVTFFHNSELNLKFCENLNFITLDKLNINLGKTYAKLRIFPKIF